MRSYAAAIRLSDSREALEVERKRARTAHRYNILIYDGRPPLAPKEQTVFDAIATGHQPATNSEVQAAHRAKEKGWIEKRSDGWQTIAHTNDVAFIPNSFVRARTGHSPLHRLVNNGELGPIMLAAELYQLQNLMDERGVPLEIIRGYFHAENCIQVERHRLHYLSPGRAYQDKDSDEEKSFDRVYNHKWRDGGGEAFWKDLRALDAAHITEWTVYSANGEPLDEYGYQRPQRPLGVLRNGKQVLNTPESRPAFMSYLVYCLQGLGEEHLAHPLPDLTKEWQDLSPIIAVENASVSHVEGVSILRMAHRAATDNRKVWYRELCKECDEAFFFVEQVARMHCPQLFEIMANFESVSDFDEAISM